MNYNILPNGDTIASAGELPAMLMAEEGNPGEVVYDDNAAPSNGSPGHNPSIGYGFNLRNETDLAFVLNQITVGGVNVFSLAAQNGYDARDVVSVLEDMISQYRSSIYPTIASLRTALSEQLGAFCNLLPGVGGNLLQLSPGQSKAVLGELISGYTVGPYTAQPIYTQLSNYLTAHGLNAADVPPDYTAEALALASMFYNSPSLIGASLISALGEGNSAEVWYQIRYQSDANDPNGGIEKRRFYESQVFSMDGDANSVAQAEQDYQMLTEHRGTIVGKEATTVFQGNLPLQIGTNPDDPTFLYTVLDETNSDYSLTGGSGGPVDAAVQTLGAEFYLDGKQIASDLDSLYGSVLPQIDVNDPSDFLFSGGGGGSFEVNSTDIFIAASAGPVNMDVDAAAGDGTIPGGAVEAAADHIIMGMTGGQTLTGGLGNDVIIAGAG